MTNHRLIDRVKNEDLPTTTTLNPIMPVIKSKVLKLFGHVRRSEDGLSRISLEGMVEGKQKRRRPPRLWRGKLNTATKDSDLWKSISHVSAQSASGRESK